MTKARKAMNPKKGWDSCAQLLPSGTRPPARLFTESPMLILSHVNWVILQSVGLETSHETVSSLCGLKEKKKVVIQSIWRQDGYISTYMMLSLPPLSFYGIEQLTGHLPMSSRGRQKSFGPHQVCLWNSVLSLTCCAIQITCLCFRSLVCLTGIDLKSCQ